MLAKVWNDFLTPIRKNCCRSSSCVSACLCCASANRHSVLSCRRLPTRPTIALHSCAWQKPSQHSLLACAALPKRLVSSNARESCDSWLKTFCSAKIPSPFVTAPIPSGPLQNGGSEPSDGQNYLLCKGRGFTTACQRVPA